MQTKLKGLKNLRKKKWFPVVSTAVIFMTLGVGLAAVFYSNQVTQQIDLKGIDGYITLEIDTPLPSLGFINEAQATSIKIERIKTNFESGWELIVVFNSTDLLASQITGNKELFELDHTTSILMNTMTMIQNGTGIVYCSISTFADWSTLITQGNSAFLDFDITFNSGITVGLIDVSVFVLEF